MKAFFCNQFQLKFFITLVIICSATFPGLSSNSTDTKNTHSQQTITQQTIINNYAGKRPTLRTKIGKENQGIPGLITKFNPRGKKEIILAFDACGGEFDRPLINFLITNKVPATLFLAGPWLIKHQADLPLLINAKGENGHPLFDLQNHGTKHQPLFVEKVPTPPYGIQGTQTPSEVYTEIAVNGQTLARLTGKQPHFFRSGTANYDDVAIAIANLLGYKVVNFTINADAGATFSKAQILKKMQTAQPGNIIIAHMNHPEGQTFAGMSAAIKLLQAKGFGFGTLSEHQADF